MRAESPGEHRYFGWAHLALVAGVTVGCSSSEPCRQVEVQEKGLDETTILGFSASEVLSGIPRAVTSTAARYGNGESTTLHVTLELGATVFERTYAYDEEYACVPTVGVASSTHVFTEDGIWDQWLSEELRFTFANLAQITALVDPEDVTGEVLERFEAEPDTGQLLGVDYHLGFSDSNRDGRFDASGSASAIRASGGLIRGGGDGYTSVKFWGPED